MYYYKAAVILLSSSLLQMTCTYPSQANQESTDPNMNPITTYKGPAIRSVSVVDAGIWVVGRKGDLIYYQVVDGKLTPVAMNPPAMVHQVYFLRADLGWIVDHVGWVYSTTDGGKTWVKKGKIGDKESVTLFDSDQIVFADPSRGWYVTSFQVLRTDNGGINWTRVYPPEDSSPSVPKVAQPTTLFPIGSQHLWLGMTYGKVLISQDYGDSWMPANFPVSRDVRALYCFTERDCWAGSTGGLYLTRDGGKNWRQVLDDERKLGMSICSVVFSTPRDGWAVGSPLYSKLEDVKEPHTILLRTRDGGMSWERSQVGLTDPRIIDFDENGFGWLVGDEDIFITETGLEWIKVLHRD